MTADYYAPRRCLRAPIPVIFHAAHLLDRAVGAHLAGDGASAAALILAADMPEIRAWTESLWGSARDNPDQVHYQRRREVAEARPFLSRGERVETRMPSAADKRSLVDRYGLHCAFCGIPVIRAETRDAIRRLYPEVLPWGATNATQHAAFQCMWLQYDHLVPHSRGGDNSADNVVIACAPCNYGRGDWPLEEVGLVDPRELPVHRTSWDGLERIHAA